MNGVYRICGMYGEEENSYRALVGKPEGTRPLGRNIWEDNITVDLKQQDGRMWTGLSLFMIRTSDSC
jgi:hypothetical protein